MLATGTCARSRSARPRRTSSGAWAARSSSSTRCASWTCRPPRSGWPSRSETRAAARRVHHEQDLRPARHRADDPLDVGALLGRDAAGSAGDEGEPRPVPRRVGRRRRLRAVAYNITQVSFRQAICPERMQGRMNAVIRFMVWGTMPVGALLGGALGTWFGLRTALWVAALGALTTFLPILLSPVPRLREVPEPGRRAAAVRGRGRGRARRCACRCAAGSRLTPPPRYRSGHARATRGRGVGARAGAARVRVAGPAGRARPHRDAEDVRPAAARARRAAASRAPTGAASGCSSRPTTASSQLRIHLMSAGRLRYLAARREGPEDAGVPAALRGRRRARAHRGRLEEAGRRLALSRRSRPRPSSPTSGPRRSGSASRRSREILAGDNRRLHSLLRDQRALAGIGRAWANEILNSAQLSPFALSTKLSDEEIERLAAAIDEELARGLELRERGARTTRTSTASTTGSASRARAAATRSGRSTTRSTRSTTARDARPAAAC